MFKDERCYKILDDTLRTYEEAEKACEKLEGTPTLAVIHSKEEQDFLTNYLFKTQKEIENFWIGAKFSAANKFIWVDSSELVYTNWDLRGPHSKANYCVEMQADESIVGKWVDVPCEKKNSVLCQKHPTWTLARLQASHWEARIALENAAKEIARLTEVVNKNNVETTQKFTETTQKLTQTNSKMQSLIPIGYVYAQLPNERPPSEIWYWMSWTDVSVTYAGVFFRVDGGTADTFGQVQPQAFPKIKGYTGYYDGPEVALNGSDHWYRDISESLRFVNHYMNGISFYDTTEEVRPRNMAIRIWKRTG